MARKTLNFDVNPLFSGPSLDTRARTGSPFRYVPVADIDFDPDQPRRVFDEQGLEELGDSIRQYGVLSPILVRVAAGGTYRLVSGERRLRACKKIGLEAIPAIVDEEGDEESSTLCKQLVENLQREDLMPMERALAIGQLKERFSLSIREIAKRLSISKSQVQRSIEILHLPDDLQSALIAGASESKILLLAQLEDREYRAELLEQLSELSREELEYLIEEHLGEIQVEEVSHRGTPAKKKRDRLSPADRRIVEEIQRSIGTKVKLQRGGKNKEKGRLVLDFYNNDDLGELHRRLVEND